MQVGVKEIKDVCQRGEDRRGRQEDRLNAQKYKEKSSAVVTAETQTGADESGQLVRAVQHYLEPRQQTCCCIRSCWRRQCRHRLKGLSQTRDEKYIL